MLQGEGVPPGARLPAAWVQDERKAAANTPAWALCTEPQGQERREEEMSDTPVCPALCWASVTQRGGAQGPGILPERAAINSDCCKRDLGAVTGKTFLQGPSGLGLLGLQVGGGVGGSGKDRGHGTVVAPMATVPQGLALPGSGGRVSPPQDPLCPQHKWEGQWQWCQKAPGLPASPAGSKAAAAHPPAEDLPGHGVPRGDVGKGGLCPCSMGGGAGSWAILEIILM